MHVVKKMESQKGDHQGFMIYCPGCKYGHLFDKRWAFNGDYRLPTFEPSMLVFKNTPKYRCHSFVENGKIRFLEDCAHDLKGKTVTLEPW